MPQPERPCPPSSIRPAEKAELEGLPAIEQRAGRRFASAASLGEIPEDLTPLAELEAAWERGHVWVAAMARGSSEELAGFAYATPLDGALHLEELSVAPEHGRRGLGRALVEAVAERARAEGFAAVTLTTFRDVPWNRPFYEKLGFAVLAPKAWTPGLAAAVEDEGRRGLPGSLRVVMRREL